MLDFDLLYIRNIPLSIQTLRRLSKTVKLQTNISEPMTICVCVCGGLKAKLYNEKKNMSLLIVV